MVIMCLRRQDRARRLRLLSWALLACTLSISAARDAGAADPSPAGLEFKFPLAAGPLSDAQNRQRLWQLIADDEAPNPSPKKCRLIQFLDTAGQDLHKDHFMLRHRMKLKTDECPDAVSADGLGELTLKRRSDGLDEATTEAEKRWAEVGTHKLEEDLVYGRCADGETPVRRAYSVSAELEDQPLPTTVAAMHERYPKSLAALAADTALTPGCRRILEQGWVLESPEKTNLPEKVELVLWYRVTEAGTRSRRAFLAELSFKADRGKPAERLRADALASRLLRSVEPSWLAPADSKTDTIYTCANP